MTQSHVTLNAGKQAPLLVALAAAVGLAMTPPIDPLDVNELERQSNLIVVGRIVSVSNVGLGSIDTGSGSVAARQMSGQIAVDVVLKGSSVSLVDFQFAVPHEPIGYGAVAASTYRVLFFKRIADHYECVSPFYPSLVAVPGTTVRGNTALDRIVEVVGSALHTAGATVEMKREAIYVLSHTRSPSAISALWAALDDGDRNIHVSALAALLMANDVRSLPIAEELLLKPNLEIPLNMLQNLRIAISVGISNPSAVRALMRLMSAGDTATRRAAASALKNTRAPTAVTALLAALDDTDFEVRLSAVHDLARITGQTEGVPSREGLRLNEQKYLSYWKEWAKRQAVK